MLSARKMTAVGSCLIPDDVHPAISLPHLPWAYSMTRFHGLSWLLFAVAVTVLPSRSQAQPAAAKPATDEISTRVYGEWRIHIRPDQGTAYRRLIEQSGLPLFREAGGRMVGWWTTLIGDLYRACDHLGIRKYGGVRARGRVVGEEPGVCQVRRRARSAACRRGTRFLRLTTAPSDQACRNRAVCDS